MNSTNLGSVAPAIPKEIPNITQLISAQIDALDTQLANLISRLMPVMVGPSPSDVCQSKPMAMTEYGTALSSLNGRLSSMTDSIQEAIRRLEI